MPAYARMESRTCRQSVGPPGPGSKRSRRRGPVHVADVAAAVAAAITSPRTPGEIFELGGPDVYRYRDLVTLVAKHRGRHPLLLPFPFVLWHCIAMTAALLPSPPLTRGQVALMEKDNVITEGRDGFGVLDIQPRSLGDAVGELLG